MNKEKITIEPNPTDASHPYTHLKPIVEALLDAGNESMYEKEFYLDKDGWRCDLKLPIDFVLVRQRFELPKSISLSSDHGSILCESTWVEIQGHGEEQMK